MANQTLLFTAVYNDKAAALDDLDAIGALHHEQMIGDYDAAVIDMEDGKPHIVKRADHPAIRAIPEAFGSGKLPRKELKDAARELKSGEAGLIVVGEATIDKGLEREFTRAINVVKRSFDEDADQLSQELSEALNN